MTVISKIEPRYQETDKMGVIHHSVYPVWYEVGRTDFCIQIGFPYHEMEKRNIGIALLNLNVNYLSPTFYGDILTLKTKITGCSRLKLEFAYEIYNQNNKLVNTGNTTHVWINDSFKPMNIAKEHQDIYNLINENIVQGD